MTIIFASPQGGTVQHEGRPIRTSRVGAAVSRALPGDTVQLLPGRYTTPFVVSEGGTQDNPITIKGTVGVVLDGERMPEAAAGDGELPDEDDFCFITLRSCGFIVLEALAFERCWPTAVFCRGCTDITMRDCEATGGQFVFFARNRRGRRDTERLTLERIRWVQDPEERMWRGDVTWNQVKKKELPHHDYYNGALFSSFDIIGHVRIRECTASHAFNAIRLDCRPDPGLTRGRHLHVHVSGCRFDHIRDNVVEAETSAENWWIYDNDIHNAHATFSLHDINGGNLYIFGNRVRLESKPGSPGQSNRSGKLLKFTQPDDYRREQGNKRYPSKPIYLLHNSFYITTFYAKGGDTRHLHQANNAIGFGFLPDQTVPDFFPLDDDHFLWHDTYAFAGDLSDHPKFPNQLGPAYRMKGIHESRFGRLFVDPHQGDLRLADHSPGLGAGVAVDVTLPNGEVVPLPAGADMGAGGTGDTLHLRLLAAAATGI